VLKLLILDKKTESIVYILSPGKAKSVFEDCPGMAGERTWDLLVNRLFSCHYSTYLALAALPRAAEWKDFCRHDDKEVLETRVARFFLVQDTKTRKKIYHMNTKCSK
jgi:hypothetical protein